MLIKFVEIQNFRKLLSCRIDFSEKETIFVGANNSGKTSAMDALILFLKERNNVKFSTRDFTLSHWQHLNNIGNKWISKKDDELPDLSIKEWLPWLPSLDLWLHIEETEIHYIASIIPTLDWKCGLLGVRLRLEPKNIETLYADFSENYHSSAVMTKGNPGKLKLWPNSLWEFLDRKLANHFKISAYILDVDKINDVVDTVAKPQELAETSLPLDSDPFNGIIKIDIINAQRGFSDANTETDGRPSFSGTLSGQLQKYYSTHLDPSIMPEPSDLDALQAIDDARQSFDARLNKSFLPSLKELEDLNYPGFGGNPSISISSRVEAMESLNHSSAVQFSVIKSEDMGDRRPITLPEKSNGLGYQNLISMVFKLIRFRDEWMQVGKKSKKTEEPDKNDAFEPIHLVLVEEPEAHLHAQVQQVFIRNAHKVLMEHELIKKHKQFKTQLVVSTHSNHIAYEINFTSLRYFKRRLPKAGEIPTSGVVNLSNVFGTDDDTTKFAIRYLRTTHCDLFFADAVILVEGSAERILLPHFIRKNYERLSSCYIAILEIGGSHSFRLRPLLQALGIITLVITDIDSGDKNNHGRAVMPEIGKGYITKNHTLKSWLPEKELLDELMNLDDNYKVLKAFPIRVAYQTPVAIQLADDSEMQSVIPYTFEIALVLKNIPMFQHLDGLGLVNKMKEAANLRTAAEANQQMFNALDNGDKAKFALELIYLEDPNTLLVPNYIGDGLEWLNQMLNSNPGEKEKVKVVLETKTELHAG